MKLGVIFPQLEIGNDPNVMRDYAQTAEGQGYTHILAFDHVLGAGVERRPEWRGPYTAEDAFHEVFVLFGYLAAVTKQVGLVAGVLVLPQRQTALVAKQAAEVDILSKGRMRLGVGVGWNQVEYEALGENFHNRGKRIEEQIDLLRRLWTEPVVDFNGQWHHIPDAGINPLPMQKPIPIWMGGSADVVLRRVARIADGWFPQMKPNETARQAIQALRQYAEQAERDPASIGIEARINLRQGNPGDWRQQLEDWGKLGATHAAINSMGMGLSSPQAHIEMLERFRSDVGLPLHSLTGSTH